MIKSRQRYITNIDMDIPIDAENGSVTVHDISVTLNLPRQLFTNILTYKKSGVAYKVPVISSKKYTFNDLMLIVNAHLNVDDQVALLYYNNGRVTQRLYKNTPFSDIKWDSNIEKLMGLNEATTQVFSDSTIFTGKPVSQDSIKFQYFNGDYLYITCDQLDVGDQTIAAVKLDQLEGKSWNYPQPTRSFENNRDKKLRLRLKDEYGSDLPLSDLLLRVTINECLSG